tara:strand:- start:201 stop:665 length:465 start_codon:yes stop_codon:yes gene_type:complete
MKYLLLSLLLSASLQAAELKLVGKSLLEFSIFKIDVYEIYFYRGGNTEEIHLNYKVDVEKKHSLTGWNKSLEHLTSKNPELKSKLNWILSNTNDYNKGDRVILRRQNTEVSLIQNNKLVAKTNDELIAKIIFEPWIGEKPIDIDIKNELLGKAI